MIERDRLELQRQDPAFFERKIKMQSVPRDIFIFILQRVPSQDCARSRQVCRYWRDAIDRAQFPLLRIHAIQADWMLQFDLVKVQVHEGLTIETSNSRLESFWSLYFGIHHASDIRFKKRYNAFFGAHWFPVMFVRSIFRQVQLRNPCIVHDLVQNDGTMIFTSYLSEELSNLGYLKGIRKIESIQTAFPGMIQSWHIFSHWNSAPIDGHSAVLVMRLGGCKMLSRDFHGRTKKRCKFNSMDATAVLQNILDDEC